MEIALLCGSLREASFNRKLLTLMGDRLKNEHTVRWISIGDLPLFNQDLEADPPAPVAQLQKDVERADLIFISSPEYNFSIPAPLKNAIDWASRHVTDKAIQGKRVALMTAAAGGAGGARAQQDLKCVLLAVTARLFIHPEVALGSIYKSFEDDAFDERTTKYVVGFAEAAVQWAQDSV